MKKKIDTLPITSSRLLKGDYKQLLPEIYSLRSIVENNPWHLNQSVFDHVAAVFQSLEKVLKLGFLKENAKKKLIKHLGNKVGNYSRKELLTISAILHDIGKTETLIKDSSGLTRCPAHEIIGSLMVSNFSSRFGLDQKAAKHVEKIIHYHGFISDVLALIINRKSQMKYFRLFKQAVGDTYIELLLLMYADMLGSDLKKNNPKEFKARERLIIEFLKR